MNAVRECHEVGCAYICNRKQEGETHACAGKQWYVHMNSSDIALISLTS